MSLQEIRIQAQQFQNRIHRRNRREYFAGSLTIALLLLEISFLPLSLLIKVALGLFALGTVNLLYGIRKRGTQRPLPADLGLTSCTDFHRLELERQRDAIGSVWRWGLLPMSPGVLVMTAALYTMPRGGLRAAVVGFILMVLYLSFFAFLNIRGARKLQRKIDALGG